MIRRPPRSTLDRSSAASDVYKRQVVGLGGGAHSQRQARWRDAERAPGQAVVAGQAAVAAVGQGQCCLLYTSPSPRDRTRSRMPSSA